MPVFMEGSPSTENQLVVKKLAGASSTDSGVLSQLTTNPFFTAVRHIQFPVNQ